MSISKNKAAAEKSTFLQRKRTSSYVEPSLRWSLKWRVNANFQGLIPSYMKKCIKHGGEYFEKLLKNQLISQDSRSDLSICKEFLKFYRCSLLKHNNFFLIKNPQYSCFWNTIKPSNNSYRMTFIQFISHSHLINAVKFLNVKIHTMDRE